MLVLVALLSATCSSEPTSGADPSAASAGRPKASQCSELVGAVNRGSENLERNAGKADAGTTDFKAMASTMDQAAKETAALKLDLAELQALGSRYQKMSGNIATHARDIAAALEVKDLEKATKAQSAMDLAAKEEAAIVDAITAFCGAP